MTPPGSIRVGIGGWDYAPWRETFYPADVPQKRQLEYASRKVTAIEVNGTFYRLQTPETFAKWRDSVPDDFVFALKAPRFTTNRRELGTAGESVARFINSGITQLGTKLGPILWQLAPTKVFDADDVEAFLKLLPARLDGRLLRHALEVRHDSFVQPAYVDLARRHNVATVIADSDKYPSLPDLTADFVYARLMNSIATCTTGYDKKTLAVWTQRAISWASGEVATGLQSVHQTPADEIARDVFVFAINGAKERAPAAAIQLLTNLRSNRVKPATRAARKPVGKRKAAKR